MATAEGLDEPGAVGGRETGLQSPDLSAGTRRHDAGLRPGQDDVELAEEALGIAGRL